MLEEKIKEKRWIYELLWKECSFMVGRIGVGDLNLLEVILCCWGFCCVELEMSYFFFYRDDLMMEKVVGWFLDWKESMKRVYYWKYYNNVIREVE